MKIEPSSFQVDCILFLRCIVFRSTSLDWSQPHAQNRVAQLLVYISQRRESEIYRAQTNPKNGESTVSGTQMSRFGVMRNERTVSRARMMQNDTTVKLVALSLYTIINTSQGSIELYIDFLRWKTPTFIKPAQPAYLQNKNMEKNNFSQIGPAGFTQMRLPVLSFSIVAVLVSCWIRRQKSITIHTIGNVTVHN